ncbi:hypothetical protein IFR05_006290 [Cadophora sp. M221]|nr:hypothetical protein IFR05_006290 [Cadophora sp. M221]
MHSLFSVFLVSAALRGALAFPPNPQQQQGKSRSKSCPPLQGNFTIDQFQLYPENADFDTRSCLFYTTNLFNSTLGVYDPYKNEIVEIIEIPGISFNSSLFLTGIEIDERTGLFALLASAVGAFTVQPFGSDLSGPNIAILWDPKSRKVLYKADLAAVSKGQYGGHDDVEFDPEGNVYINTFFPGTILKVERPRGSRQNTTPKVTEWYLNQPRIPANAGFGGMAATRGWDLLTYDNSLGRLLKFDMRALTGTPIVVPVTPNEKFAGTDANYLPPRYKGTVLLLSGGPGVRVLRSKDGNWDEAEFVGTVLKSDFGIADAHLVTAVVQVGEGLNMVVLPFGDAVVPGTLAGNRTQFPFYDITGHVDRLLAV